MLFQALVAWGVEMSEEQQAYINAAAAVMGLALALTVARDQIVPAAVGLLGAVLQLLVSFGMDISQEKIATAGAVLAAWLRTQVAAPVAPDGSWVPKATVHTNQAWPGDSSPAQQARPVFRFGGGRPFCRAPGASAGGNS